VLYPAIDRCRARRKERPHSRRWRSCPRKLIEPAAGIPPSPLVGSSLISLSERESAVHKPEAPGKAEPSFVRSGGNTARRSTPGWC
jgi:hypothetical protein